MTNQLSNNKQSKFLLLEGVHPSSINLLKNSGYTNIEIHKGSLDSNELKKAISDASFVGIRSRTQITQEILDVATDLTAIGCFCIGTNQVDLKAAALKGIPVFNAPFSNTRSVAELVIGEIILLLRRIPEVNAKAHAGKWNKFAEGAYETRGKKLGIIGYGHIGSQVSVMAESLGMKVYFYDVDSKLPLGNAKQINTLNELLQKCDVISLHVPEISSTINLISEKELALMKSGSILINASRGKVVDIKALTKALEDKHIAGAAIDVFPSEPKTNSEPFISPLCQFDNVIITPHIGGSTVEAQENIGLEVSAKLIKNLESGSTLSAVNFPEVSLPIPLKGVTRFLNIHRNQPGVLTAINNLFANNNLNISAQYLQTTADIGYVVIDIDNVEVGKADNLLNSLNKIPETVKSKLLF